MKKLLFLLVVLTFLGATSCATAGSPTSTPQATATPSAIPDSPTPVPPSPTPTLSPTPAPSSGTYRLEDAYPSLSFTQPLLFAVAPGDAADAFVVERTGRTLIFADRPDAVSSQVFLDLRSVVTANGQEQGLLGLAFHPRYTENGYFYVNYTTSTTTVIARYRRSAADPRVADPASQTVLLTFEQPYRNHNGGGMAFGPDGFLYIATGDGGSGGDPQNRAQDLSSPLGKILRIDVDHPGDGMAYGIPSDNPFVGNAEGYRQEIYAYGLRNPWRFSFDAQGTLWAGDVGQDRIEEIDLVRKGGNYGWALLEGPLDYKEIAGVDRATLVPPVWEYEHSLGEAVTGGFVYTGRLAPHLKGTFVFGDYVSGRIWALWIDADGTSHGVQLLDSTLHVSSFGLDAAGELRVVDLSGKVYRLVETGA
jgi:glucose/arabinose dehydrogenase